MVFLSGTSVIQVTATDADDPTYGNSARVVYSILQGQPYFSVDSRTGMLFHQGISQWENQKKNVASRKKGQCIIAVVREMCFCDLEPRQSSTV